MKPPIVFWIFAALGIVMLAGEGYYVTDRWSFVERSRKAQGTVTRIETKISSGRGHSTTYAPRVRFVSPDGLRHEFTSEMSSSWQNYSVGQPVRVIYDPAKPDTADIDSWFVIWGGAVIFGFLGSVFFLVGAGNLVWIWRRRKYCAALLRNGVRISATGGRVEQDCSQRINGRCAWRIICEADYNGEHRIFKSDRLWADPTEAAKDQPVTIAIDPENPQKYCLDLSFFKHG